MRPTLTARTRRRLDIQGFDTVDEQGLVPVAPWLRLSFGLCALLGGVGTLLASRFGCGMGAAMLLVTAWAFSAGHVVVGYALGGAVTFAALLVSTTDI